MQVLNSKIWKGSSSRLRALLFKSMKQNSKGDKLCLNRNIHKLHYRTNNWEEEINKWEAILLVAFPSMISNLNRHFRKLKIWSGKWTLTRLQLQIMKAKSRRDLQPMNKTSITKADKTMNIEESCKKWVSWAERWQSTKTKSQSFLKK